MRTLQLRMAGHSTLPDAEVVLCLFGRVSQDTVYVERVSEAEYTERSTLTNGVESPGARYYPCEAPDYIGAYHSHPAGPWGNGCWHSPLDLEALMTHEREIVQVISCTKDGSVYIHSRVKRGYSLR
jgi:hypothetical protein